MIKIKIPNHQTTQTNDDLRNRYEGPSVVKVHHFHLQGKETSMQVQGARPKKQWKN